MNDERVPGKLYLIPSSLGENSSGFFTVEFTRLINSIHFFIVENERSARRFLRTAGFTGDFDAIQMMRVESDAEFVASAILLDHFKSGKDAGVISDAGSPGIADPGGAAVRFAHKHRIRVVPLIGPSSIFLALMASGLNGQQFAFHGYLPVSSVNRKDKLKQLELESGERNQTQVFMETPYRNNSLLQDVISVLKPSTLLCIAASITTHDEFIFTQQVAAWKLEIPDLKKKPSLFLMLAN